MLKIDHSKCTVCRSCVDECHRYALDIIDSELVWDEEKCYGCGHCMALCPREALMYDGDGYNIMDVEEFNFTARPKQEHIRELTMMRRSIRNYTDSDVSDEDLNMILEAGKYSPTAENKQGNVFLVIKDEDERKKILDDSMKILDGMCDDVLSGKDDVFSEKLASSIKKNVILAWEQKGEDRLFHGAPVFIYVFSDTVQDGTIAATTMGNMAYGLRLGFCYIRIAADIFKDEGLRKKYGIPDGKVPAMAISVGEPDVEFFCTVPRKDPLTIIL